MSSLTRIETVKLHGALTMSSDAFFHDLRQPGRLRQFLNGETYYRFQPDAEGNCMCPHCTNARKQREKHEVKHD